MGTRWKRALTGRPFTGVAAVALAMGCAAAVTACATRPATATGAANAATTSAPATVSPAPYGKPAGTPVTVSPNPPAIDSVAVAPSGTLYAVMNRCGGCAGGADLNILLRSADLGSTWSTVGPIPMSGGGGPMGQLVAASDSVLWYVHIGVLSGTTDGGRTWRRWPVPAGVDFSTGGRRSLVAGGVLWLLDGAQALTAAPGEAPALTPARLPSTALTAGIAAQPGGGVLVLDATGAGYGTAALYRTTDRGAHWTALTDPCAGFGMFSPQSSVAAAPDGTLWVVCGGPGTSFSQGKHLVTSADGGRTWVDRGALESTGHAIDVAPVSATVAWRTGGAGDVYHTADATRWTRAWAATGTSGAMDTTLIAVNAGTALFVDFTSSTQTFVLEVTADGGRTWVTRRFPA